MFSDICNFDYIGKTIFYFKKYFVVILVLVVGHFDLWTKLEGYISNIDAYFLVGLVISACYSLIKSSRLDENKVINNGIIHLTTNNDYGQKATSLILSTCLIIVSLYFLFFSDYYKHLNVLIFLVFSILIFANSFFVTRSLALFLDNNKILYEINKEKKSIDLNNLKEIEFGNNQIVFKEKKQKVHEISFLEITNDDIKIALGYLRIKLNPEIEIRHIK